MHSLAFTPTPFIGRSQEINEISALLDDPSCRLLTLVGQGGIGKTRLALEVAARKQESFPDGVFFVSLAPLIRTDDILTTIAEATPLRFQKDERAPRDQFLDYLREKDAKRLLFILDNFEHLLDGVDIISEILAVTTNLKIIATSREALNLQEEWVRQISGLSYPDQNNGKALEDYGAVQLFMDRARRIRGNFDISEDTKSVLEICRLVEGMPLAIELAVGWLKTLPLTEIVHEIQHNMDILATRSRNLPERHRSIRSVFSHSWQLMTEDERDAFQKMSIFRGGFTREAAETVAGASLHILAVLVDKSLVRLSAAGRYDVHELLRQYGAEQMNAADQTPMIQQAYIAYYLDLLRTLERDIKAHHQRAALDTIQADFENVRNAWQMAVEQGHFELLNQAVESLHFFADMRGHYHEVVTLLQSAVEHSNPDQNYRIQARLARLTLLGNIRINGDLRSLIDNCLAVARAHHDQAEIGFCLLVSGLVTIWEKRNDWPHDFKLKLIFQESYAIYEALNDPFYKAETLAWIAPSISYDTAHEHNPMIELLQRSLDLRREIEDLNGIAWITRNLAETVHGQLDYIESERYARQALALMREIGSIKGILHSMFKLTEMTMLRGDLEEARTLAEEMRDLADETNNLDGKMLSLGLLSFLLSVMDENYSQGADLAQKNYALSLEPFFGWNDLAARWGQGVANCGMGHYEAARLNYTSFCWERRDDPGPATIIFALEAAARAHEGAYEAATELLGLAFHQPVWVSGWLHHWQLLERLRADLILQLGIDVYQAAFARGSALNLETTLKSILGELDTAITPRLTENQSLLEPLSERELQVLGLIADGLSNRDIAERLVLSVGTVKVHTRNIYGKLNVNSRTQALTQASRFNLL